MEKYFLTVGSVTHAIMARDTLRLNGIPAKTVKTPAGLDKKGCGYSLMINGNPEEAVRIVGDSGIRVTGVFKERL